MNTTEVFAERFKQLRADKKLSLQKVATDLNVTAQSLSLYEKGQRTINIDLLKRVAEYFGVSSDYLIGLSDVSSSNMELTAVCHYTGLNNEAIENIINHTSSPKSIYDELNVSVSRTVFTPKYYEINKKVLNQIFSCSWFWDIIFNYVIMSNLQEQSFEYKKNYDAACQALLNEKNIDEIYDIIQKPTQYCNDIDVARYTVTRLIEKISDIFDGRIKTEALNNGKHNTKEK